MRAYEKRLIEKKGRMKENGGKDKQERRKVNKEEGRLLEERGGKRKEEKERESRSERESRIIAG